MSCDLPKCKHLHALWYIGALEMFKLGEDSKLRVLLLAFSPKKHTMSNHLFFVSVTGKLLKAWVGNGCFELVTRWYLEGIGKKE